MRDDQVSVEHGGDDKFGGEMAEYPVIPQGEETVKSILQLGNRREHLAASMEIYVSECARLVIIWEITLTMLQLEFGACHSVLHSPLASCQ